MQTTRMILLSTVWPKLTATADLCPVQLQGQMPKAAYSPQQSRAWLGLERAFPGVRGWCARLGGATVTTAQ